MSERALEQSIARQGQPQGLVRINASTSTGQHLLVPLVAELMQTWPGLQLDLSFTDHVVDLIEARADIAIRDGVIAEIGRIPDHEADEVLDAAGQDPQRVSPIATAELQPPRPAPRPPPALAWPSPISSTPEAFSAPTSFISESTLPRITSSDASMRWMVGRERREVLASARWSMAASSG